MAEVLPSDELIDEPSDYGSLRPGTRLGRYELLVPIARGGMARVWAGRLHGQRGFQKPVAIKTILPHLADEPEFEKMFLDEARIAAGVHHPNVCEIYELGEESQTLYLAMEWVTGDSFSRVLRASGRTEAVDARVAARLVADACAGLHAAHELTDDAGRQLGVVHRDLSPHNILLTADGVAKVADFGVAKALGQLHEATSAGQLKGKIAYMAPEQVTGGAIDRRCDVFSLGCVLYEATTGQRPFRGDGDHQVMHQILKGEVTPPSSLVQNYPQELERIILRAMSSQAILRFATAERMRFALEEFLARGPLVTQSNVAQLVRARIGEHLDRRRERIRQASNATDAGTWSEPPGNSMTPSGQGHDAHRSGVKQAGARPLLISGTPMPPSMPGAPPVPHGYGLHPGHGAPHFGTRDAGPMAQPYMGTPPPPASGPMGQHPHAMSPSPSSPGFSHQPYPPAFDPAQGQRGISSQPPPAAQYVIAAGVGILLAVLIGTGGFLGWRARHRVGTPPPIATGASAAKGAPSASPEILVKVIPSDATLTVDGVDLADDARSLPRPRSGQTLTLVAHARGYEAQTTHVDSRTMSPLDLALKPVESAAEGPAADPPKVEPKAETPKIEAPPKSETPRFDPPRPRPAPRTDPGLPANPY